LLPAVDHDHRGTVRDPVQFYGWNQYLWPLLITTQDSMQTIVTGIRKMLTTRPTNWRNGSCNGHRHPRDATAGRGWWCSCSACSCAALVETEK